jgi:fructose-1,6-bisphosphatase/inositol monophosphatase family enzyme
VRADLDDVARLLQEAAAEAVDPRFRALQAGQVEEKSPGDLVTAADHEAEQLITAGLLRLDPGAVVVGEEAVAADPALLGRVAAEPRVWLVDPVDGTANFVAGSPEHAVMAALLDRGEPVAAVIWHPQYRVLWTAERGSGAYRDGERLPPAPRTPDLAVLNGHAAATYLPPDTRAVVEANASRFAGIGPGYRCCGTAYPRIATGVDGFALFWKAMPWDHAPGALLLRETGGAVRRWDGTDYRPAAVGTGLLATSDAAAWEDVRAALLDPALEPGPPG